MLPLHHHHQQPQPQYSPLSYSTITTTTTTILYILATIITITITTTIIPSAHAVPQQKFPEDFYDSDTPPPSLHHLHDPSHPTSHFSNFELGLPTTDSSSPSSSAAGSGNNNNNNNKEDEIPPHSTVDLRLIYRAMLDDDHNNNNNNNNNNHNHNTSHLDPKANVGDRAIPQKCWYKSSQYDCGLSVSCVFQGSKPFDLCSGGMIWSCCVPRDKVDAIDENLGAIGNDVSHHHHNNNNHHHQQGFNNDGPPPGTSFTHLGSSNNNRPLDSHRPSSSSSSFDDDRFFPNTQRPSSILVPHRPQDRPSSHESRPPHRPLRPLPARPPHPFARPDFHDDTFSSSGGGGSSPFGRPHNTFPIHHQDPFDSRPHQRPGFSRPRPSPFEESGPVAVSRHGFVRGSWRYLHSNDDDDQDDDVNKPPEVISVRTPR
ncbi:hypothetical protein Pmani_039094 [Petrolisthes manimaculis]|uniref:Uncharacterized protein n=1 Tax=Petrolisthes manimaculis TaxID=1843537 RepID=A0AAE1NDD1_9EUCA|nr:hypothetical protein Pmani_039094 [Petrolisthes manimaculis]